MFADSALLLCEPVRALEKQRYEFLLWIKIEHSILKDIM